MKNLSRALLKLLTLGIPVVIAACYGMPYKYNASGKVIDKGSHQPIPGISVACLKTDGSTLTATTTGQDGSFYIGSDTGCAGLSATDVDGATNGSFKPASAPFSDTDNVTIEMIKA